MKCTETAELHRTVNARLLYRSHARLLLTGILIQVPALLLIVILTLHPVSPALLLLPLPAALAAAALELPVLWRFYRPLRKLDGLSTEQRYAQNEDLSRGVVFLHNLPLASFGRVYLLRSTLIAGATHLLLGLDPAHPGLEGTSAWAFWLLAMTMVPLLPAAFEMLSLPPLVDRYFPLELSYRGALSPEWKRRIVLAGTGIRMVFAIFALCAAPLIALTLLGDLELPGDPLLLASCGLTIGAFLAALVLRDTRRSLDVLLEGMRQVGRNRPHPSAAVNSGDEFALAGEGFAQMVAGLKEQSFIRETFGKYVPKAIVETVLRNGVRLQGERRHVTILLVDIHRFRARIERESAVEAIALLNQYLSVVTAAVQHFGGTIDKVNGDRVLAVFGAPVTLNAPVERALFAAIDVRKGMDRLNRRLEHAGCEPLRLSIAIHQGQAVSGHVGAAERMEYSVIGQAVYDTYRITTLTRHHPVDIVVSAAARRQAGDQFQFAGPLALAEDEGEGWELYSLVDVAEHSPG